MASLTVSGIAAGAAQASAAPAASSPNFKYRAPVGQTDLEKPKPGDWSEATYEIEHCAIGVGKDKKFSCSVPMSTTMTTSITGGGGVSGSQVAGGSGTFSSTYGSSASWGVTPTMTTEGEREGQICRGKETRVSKDVWLDDSVGWVPTQLPNGRMYNAAFRTECDPYTDPERFLPPAPAAGATEKRTVREAPAGAPGARATAKAVPVPAPHAPAGAAASPRMADLPAGTMQSLAEYWSGGPLPAIAEQPDWTLAQADAYWRNQYGYQAQYE